VCTTELGLVAALQEDFDARNVKVIGLSANELESHEKWIADINEVNSVDLKFPIIADPKREISALYDMLDYQVRILSFDKV
jgi:glutaredoxin/glutathione-dependent peroxiredoxin